MALDQTFDDGRVQTANAVVSASTVSESTVNHYKFTINSKRISYDRRWSLDETAATVVLSSEGKKRPQSFTQAAQNELKLDKG